MYSIVIMYFSCGVYYVVFDIFIYLYFVGIVKVVDVMRGVFYISIFVF